VGASRYLFDDNPATQDLMGLRSVAVAISNVIVDQRFDTVTVGLNSPWGGGKSTALNLIETELRGRADVVVVVIDPWEFVDSGDPRGTLIARVLEGIAVELDRRRLEGDGAGVKAKLAEVAVDLVEKLNALRKRVSWSKVAQVAIKSAVNMTPDIGGMVEALTPEPEKEPAAKGMRGFREDFGGLLAEMQGCRVVVLIDDLDRSLPDDVLGALEAIKLFLSVKGMAFVIAADDDFIRESLRDALDRHGGSRGRFADRYTEKIVQLPFTLPRLSSADAVAYLAALFVQAEAGRDVAVAVAEKAAARRVKGEAPYVAPKMHESMPTDEHIRLANQIVRGMSSSRRETPRQLKRFLNNFAVRAEMLGAQFEGFPVETLMKLWLLEQNHPHQFRDLVGTRVDQRPQLLARWEADTSEIPAEISAWANEPPKATDVVEWVDRYVSFATATVATLQSAAALDDEQSSILAQLTDPSTLTRAAAVQQMADVPSTGDEDVARHLATAIVGDRSDYALESLQALAVKRVDLKPAISSSLLDDFVLGALSAQHIPWLTPSFPEVVAALRSRPGASPELLAAIDEEMLGVTI
jgi:hypothetical protein